LALIITMNRIAWLPFCGVENSLDGPAGISAGVCLLVELGGRESTWEELF
jgi:hypothetical protein